MYSHLEDYIYDLLKTIKINNPSQLNVENAAKELGLEVFYGRKAYRVYNHIILERGTRQQEWQLFAHELCHYLRHYGSQLNMHSLFMDLQEYQADHFAYHFCVPTFMLEQLGEVTVYDIMNLFNVDFKFAMKRLEIYQNKQYIREAYHENYIVG